MTIEEYNRKLREFVQDLDKNNRPFARAVQSSVQLEAKRIFTDGKNSDDGQIGKYKEGSYKKKRKKEGRQTDYIDLKFHGDLFADFTNSDPNANISQARATRVNAHSYVVKLDRPINQTKMEAAEERFGEISDPTKKEEKNLEKVALQELINDLTKKGLA